MINMIDYNSRFLLFLSSIKSNGALSAIPNISNPQQRLESVAGDFTFIDSINYFLDALMISAKTPLAVTSAPAPAPFITKGCCV